MVETREARDPREARYAARVATQAIEGAGDVAGALAMAMVVLGVDDPEVAERRDRLEQGLENLRQELAVWRPFLEHYGLVTRDLYPDG